MPRYKIATDLNPEELDRDAYLNGLNQDLSGALSPPTNPMYADNPAATQAAVAGYENTFDDDGLIEEGAGLGTAGSLRLVGAQAKAQDYRNQSQEAAKNATDMLREALASKSYVSPSQGFAAALLASIPALAGIGIGKMVKSPKIPDGVYFPDMGGKEFKETFGYGGDAAAAQGVQVGATAGLGYLGDIEKENTSRVPVLEKMADLEKTRSTQLENEAGNIERQILTQAGMDERSRERQQFMQEERRIRAEERDADRRARDPYAALPTEEERQAARLREKGYDPQTGKKLLDPNSPLRTDIAHAKGLVSLASKTVEAFEKMPNMTWAQYQAAKIPALDQTKVRQRLNLLVEAYGREVSGAVIPASEKKSFYAFIDGGDTMSPAKAVSYIKEFAELVHAQKIQSPIETERAFQSSQGTDDLYSGKGYLPQSGGGADRLDRINAIAARMQGRE